jgi:hypothetical protein
MLRIGQTVFNEDDWWMMKRPMPMVRSNALFILQKYMFFSSHEASESPSLQVET